VVLGFAFQTTCKLYRLGLGLCPQSLERRTAVIWGFSSPPPESCTAVALDFAFQTTCKLYRRGLGLCPSGPLTKIDFREVTLASLYAIFFLHIYVK
jgi:hypothetical protein